MALKIQIGKIATHLCAGGTAQGSGVQWFICGLAKSASLASQLSAQKHALNYQKAIDWPGNKIMQQLATRCSWRTAVYSRVAASRVEWNECDWGTKTLDDLCMGLNGTWGTGKLDMLIISQLERLCFWLCRHLWLEMNLPMLLEFSHLMAGSLVNGPNISKALDSCECSLAKSWSKSPKAEVTWDFSLWGTRYDLSPQWSGLIVTYQFHMYFSAK